MTFNIALQTEVLVQIELAQAHKNPLAGWGQGEWAKVYAEHADVTNDYGDIIVDEKTGLPIGVGSCGSAMCDAGWALSLSKVPLVWHWDDDEDDALIAVACIIDGQRSGVQEAAVKLLGYPNSIERPDLWTYTKYDEYMPALFDTENDLDDLYRITAEVAGVNEVELRADVLKRVAEIVGVKA